MRHQQNKRALIFSVWIEFEWNHKVYVNGTLDCHFRSKSQYEYWRFIVIFHLLANFNNSFMHSFRRIKKHWIKWKWKKVTVAPQLNAISSCTYDSALTRYIIFCDCTISAVFHRLMQYSIIYIIASYKQEHCDHSIQLFSITSNHKSGKRKKVQNHLIVKWNDCS